MGRLLRENPANSPLLGGGRRAGTLRLRVRVVQKFLSWLALSHNLAFPEDWRQLIEYMQVRLSEPCVRGSLKLIHLSYIFMQEVAGVEDRLTDSALYDVTKRELLASALPGKQPRQAPRFPVIVLAALEANVIALDTPVFWRVLSWWILLQSWATLRFDDHRGKVPSDLNVSETGLVGKLTRSKVSGPDKKLNYRLLVVHSSSHVQHKDWLVSGWKVLDKEAPYIRDYLLPAPTNNFRGFKRKELKYQAAFGIQSQIISWLSCRGQRLFRASTGHYFSPHSGRNFLPTATAVLGFSRFDRDMLGGWSAEGSERYSRAAKHKIATMQNAVRNHSEAWNLIRWRNQTIWMGLETSSRQGKFRNKKFTASRRCWPAVLLQTFIRCSFCPIRAGPRGVCSR